MRYMIKFMYDGSSYQGFAQQKHKNTIQDEIQSVLEIINKHETKFYGTSRTDSKVHALDIYGIFDSDIKISEDQMKKALNSLLCDNIYVKEVYIVDDNYFPRYQVEYKIYSNYNY